MKTTEGAIPYIQQRADGKPADRPDLLGMSQPLIDELFAFIRQGRCSPFERFLNEYGPRCDPGDPEFKMFNRPGWTEIKSVPIWSPHNID